MNYEVIERFNGGGGFHFHNRKQLRILDFSTSATKSVQNCKFVELVSVFLEPEISHCVQQQSRYAMY